MRKVTDWYPGIVKPVRVGWYEREHSLVPDYRLWFDGKYWRYRPGDLVCTYQNEKRWRGLRSPV